MRPAMIWSIVADMLGPGALRSGLTPLSQVAGLYLCTEATLALFSRLDNEITACLCFSSGSRIGLSLKSAPAPLGVQRSISFPCFVFDMTAPWGIYKKPARRFGAASVLASAVAAGILGSSNGSP